MRTWDRLSATFVRGLKKPGKYYDGGGLMLSAATTKTTDVVTKSWLFRFQIDKRERFMGLGSARVVSLAEVCAKANEARKLLAAGLDPLNQTSPLLTRGATSPATTSQPGWTQELALNAVADLPTTRS